MTEEVVLMLVGNSRDVFVSLDLRSGSREEVDIHGIAVIASSKWTEMGRNMRTVIRGLDGE
jgi:hypothetical protein